jgi:hypothetical protein
MKSKQLPSQDYLLQRLDYNSETGVIRWRPILYNGKTGNQSNQKWNSKFAGKVAGCWNTKTGYWVVRIDDKLYQTHRIIWCMVTGEDPGDSQIDHRDRDRSNNRIKNLRLANNSENQCNRKVEDNNQSGIKGIYFHKQGQKWAAEIKIDGEKHHLGLFEEIECASLAIQAARNKYHGEFAHHSIRN